MTSAKCDIVRLGDVCKVVSGSTPKTSVSEFWGGEFPWITPAELKGEVIIVDTERKLTQKGVDSCSLKIIPKGTVLLTSRAPIGKVAIAGCDMYCNQGFKNLICGERVYNRYLFYWLRSHVEYLNSLGRGATFKEISKTIVEGVQIPLPPLAEQKRIAEELDNICAAKKDAEAIVEKLKLLAKSLFVEMFGDEESSFAWGDVFEAKTGKLDSNAAVENGKYPFFTCAKAPLYINDYAFEGDALLLAGNNAAGVYDVKYYSGRFNAYQRTYVLRLKNPLWSYQLFKVQLENKLNLLQHESKGTMTKYLTMGILSKLQFIVPPVNLQHEFAAFIEQLDKSQFEAQALIGKLDLLYRAKLQEYFG